MMLGEGELNGLRLGLNSKTARRKQDTFRGQRLGGSNGNEHSQARLRRSSHQASR